MTERLRLDGQRGESKKGLPITTTQHSVTEIHNKMS
jgi:hypothetical protein